MRRKTFYAQCQAPSYRHTASNRIMPMGTPTQTEKAIARRVLIDGAIGTVAVLSLALAMLFLVVLASHH